MLNTAAGANAQTAQTTNMYDLMDRTAPIALAVALVLVLAFVFRLGTKRGWCRPKPRARISVNSVNPIVVTEMNSTPSRKEDNPWELNDAARAAIEAGSAKGSPDGVDVRL